MDQLMPNPHAFSTMFGALSPALRGGLMLPMADALQPSLAGPGVGAEDYGAAAAMGAEAGMGGLPDMSMPMQMQDSNFQAAMAAMAEQQQQQAAMMQQQHMQMQQEQAGMEAAMQQVAGEQQAMEGGMEAAQQG
jgi:hypothetical protein